MEQNQLDLIRKHWENYLGTTLNMIYIDEEFQAVGSRNLEKPSYNQVVPLRESSDLSNVKQAFSSIPHSPVVHGERKFIENFVHRNFAEAEKAGENVWMQFSGHLPREKQFSQLDFRYILRKNTDDYLNVQQNAFETSDSYIDLHRSPFKKYNSETYRMVVYDDRPISAGELRLNNGKGFIYTLSTIKEERGRGIATEVLRRLLLKAEDLEIDSVYLIADPSLEDFYSSIGFEQAFKVDSYSIDLW